MVGDVMYDIFLESQGLLNGRRILSELDLIPKEYLLLTIHRAENTDNLNRLGSILLALAETKEKVVFPIHPRTKNALKKIKKLLSKDNGNFLCIKPVGYLDMLALEKNARKILTDSGGIQKEAYWLRVPCITLRDETEWVETVKSGWNIIAGANKSNIVKAVLHTKTTGCICFPYRKRDAATKIINILVAATSPMHI
jgi:UDP-N-acetylglucosamine 2-epimerase